VAFSVACLHFPSCMLSLLADVFLCAFASSYFSGAELHVPFQPSELLSLATSAGLLWDQLLQEFYRSSCSYYSP